MKRFLNKKTLVTGGASGIGKAICQRLVEEGASLVFIDRNIEAGKAFEQELSNQESSSLFVAADLTNEDEVERGFHETKKILGHIDVLINNAGGVIKTWDNKKIFNGGKIIACTNNKIFDECVKILTKKPT